MGAYASIIKKKIKRFAAKQLPSLGASLLILALIAFALYSSLDLNPLRLETTPAVRSTEYEIAGLTGYIFRDEEVLYSSRTGASVYRVGDGERLSADTELARVYSSGDTALYLAARRELEGRISLLERSVRLGRPNAAGVDETRRALAGSYTSIMNSLAKGDIPAGAALGEDFLIALNANALITGDGRELTERLSELQARLAALIEGYGGDYESLRTPGSGYFFYGVDGFEGVFDYGKIPDLDRASLAQMTAAPARPDTSGRQAVGKMVYDYVWYLAVPADAALCGKLDGAGRCRITFAGGLALEMTLERVSLAPGEEEGVLIFSSGQMPGGFDYARSQSIELLVDEINGYRVPLSALRELRGIKGVYVLSSSTVIFRRVSILYEGEGYIVAAERDISAENYSEFLDLNDPIIVSVSDGELYEGRLIN